MGSSGRGARRAWARDARRGRHPMPSRHPCGMRVAGGMNAARHWCGMRVAGGMNAARHWCGMRVAGGMNAAPTRDIPMPPRSLVVGAPTRPPGITASSPNPVVAVPGAGAIRVANCPCTIKQKPFRWWPRDAAVPAPALVRDTGRGRHECRPGRRCGMRVAGGMNAARHWCGMRVAGGMNAAPTVAAGRGRSRPGIGADANRGRHECRPDGGRGTWPPIRYRRPRRRS